MKYTLEIDINLPRHKVVELFDNPYNLKHWQPELISFEHLSGTPGEAGATSRLIYNMNGRETEMIETVTLNNLPDEFSGKYKTNGTTNTLENFFEEIDENKTRWTSVCEFKSGKLIMKLMMFFMPGAFKKQSRKFMENFKAFAESSG